MCTTLQGGGPFAPGGLEDFVDSQKQQTPGPEEARHRAVRSMTDGHFDGRDVHGAIANALESIAWSMIAKANDATDSDDMQEGLDDALHRIGLLRVEQ